MRRSGRTPPSSDTGAKLVASRAPCRRPSTSISSTGAIRLCSARRPIAQQRRESVIPLTRERRDPAFRWREWLNQHILLIGQVALIAQSLAPRSAPSSRPSTWLPPRIDTHGATESQAILDANDFNGYFKRLASFWEISFVSSTGRARCNSLRRLAPPRVHQVGTCLGVSSLVGMKLAAGSRPQCRVRRRRDRCPNTGRHTCRGDHQTLDGPSPTELRATLPSSLGEPVKSK
jgi:hypothetical protein